jgi:hypothetical protein
MTDQELLALMPETMRDEFSYAARVCSDATGGKVKPGIFRVALDIVALEYARAVLGAADAKPTSLEAALQPQDKLDRLIEMDRTATDHFPDIKKMVTTCSLLERVVMAAGRDGETARWNEARAAIREVAAWLREQHDGDLVAATVLEREAER